MIRRGIPTGQARPKTQTNPSVRQSSHPSDRIYARLRSRGDRGIAREAHLIERLADDFFYVHDGQGRTRRLVSDAELRSEVSLLFRAEYGGRESFYHYLRRRYIFQIYTGEFIEELGNLLHELQGDAASPVVEAGAGDGALSRFLRARGLNMLAIDDQSWEGGIAYAPEVQPGPLQDVLTREQPRVVLACWPPDEPNDDLTPVVFAHPSVRYYVHIGHGREGLTGSKAIWSHPHWRHAMHEPSSRWAWSQLDCELVRGHAHKHTAVTVFERQ